MGKVSNDASMIIKFFASPQLGGIMWHYLILILIKDNEPWQEIPV